MSRLSRLALAGLVAAALPACDAQFSEGGAFDCRAGATASGTIDGRAFTADCVEVGDGATFFVGAYENYGEAGEEAAPDEPFGSFRLEIGGTAVGSYPVTASGATTLDFFYSPGDDPDGRSTDVSVTATAGEATLAAVSADRFAGTVAFSGPERVGPDGGTATGETVSGSVTFSVPR